MPPPKNQPQLPVIRVAPLGELNAYTVYEHELETLAEGSPAGVFLNFALALLPMAVGVIVTLRSSTMTDLNFTLFTSASIIFIIAGAICLVLWWKMRRGVNTLVEDIKRRMPPQGIQAAAPAPSPPPP
jgi:uncharacterized membrane-anchored protein